MTPAQLIEKYRFKPEDFMASASSEKSNSLRPREAAFLANAKLLELFEGAKVVYWREDSLGSSNKMFTKTPQDTHTALLICIEELPKKECVHELGEIGLYDTGTIAERMREGRKLLAFGKCRHCGIELKPKWEPA